MESLKGKQSLQQAYFVTGEPHVLQKYQEHPSYAALKQGLERVAQKIADADIERIVYYSSAWLAVLDQMFQARSEIKGVHVDENWYAFGPLTYHMRVDAQLSKQLAEQTKKEGSMATRLVNYDGFPIDTATIVANSLINPHGIPISIVANNVYTDIEATRQLTRCLLNAIEQYGKKTAFVVIGGLSGRYITRQINLMDDQFEHPEDDQWNRRLLEHFKRAEWHKAWALREEFAAATKAAMGFKTLGLVYETLNTYDGFAYSADVLAYGPVYGTGQVVMQFWG